MSTPRLIGPFTLLFLLLPVAAFAQGLRIITVEPASQSMHADPRAPLLVTFDHVVDPSSVGPLSLLVFGRWSGVMTGTLAFEEHQTRLRFTPSRPFSAGERVTVMLARDIRTADGTTMERGHTWQFWIRALPASLDLTLQGLVDVRNRGKEDWIQAYGAYAGDFDGDGYSDLAVPNERTNDVRVFLNDGAGGYGAYDTYPLAGGNRPSPNEGSDFNRDGIIDFAVGNSQNDQLAVFTGAGDGSFATPQNYTAEDAVRGVTVLDFDGDGFPDLATSNRIGSTGFGTLSLFQNRGDGTFSPALHADTPGNQETAVEAADADGDGGLELFIGALLSQEVLVYAVDEAGRFTERSRAGAGGQPWMIATGDVNGDGFVDVVTANSQVATTGVLFGDGEGNLTPAVTYPTGTFPLAVDLGDLDGDGDLDLVTSDFGGPSWTLYENDGTGTFINRRTLFATGAGSCAILHDRDNNGTLDLTGIDEIEDRIFLFVNAPHPVATDPLPRRPLLVLEPVYPNPFGDLTRFWYELDRPAYVSIQVFNASGRLVRVLTDEARGPGRYVMTWDGTDASGRRLPSGLYVYRLQAGDVRLARTMVLMR